MKFAILFSVFTPLAFGTIKSPLKPTLSIPKTTTARTVYVNPPTTENTGTDPFILTQQPWYPALIYVILAIIIVLILTNKPSTTTVSTEFTIVFSTLPQDQQNILNTFKAGPHSWKLNGIDTGAIISDLILNQQQVGFQLRFDTQRNMYVNYTEILSLYTQVHNKPTGSITVPDRFISSNVMMNSIQNSYTITLSNDVFTLTYT